MYVEIFVDSILFKCLKGIKYLGSRVERLHISSKGATQLNLIHFVYSYKLFRSKKGGGHIF